MAINWKKEFEVAERFPLSTRALDNAGHAYSVELRKQGGHALHAAWLEQLK